MQVYVREMMLYRSKIFLSWRGICHSKAWTTQTLPRRRQNQQVFWANLDCGPCSSNQGWPYDLIRITRLVNDVGTCVARRKQSFQYRQGIVTIPIPKRITWWYWLRAFPKLDWLVSAGKQSTAPPRVKIRMPRSNFWSKIWRETILLAYTPLSRETKFGNARTLIAKK